MNLDIPTFDLILVDLAIKRFLLGISLTWKCFDHLMQIILNTLSVCVILLKVFQNVYSALAELTAVKLKCQGLEFTLHPKIDLVCLTWWMRKPAGPSRSNGAAAGHPTELWKHGGSMYEVLLS